MNILTKISIVVLVVLVLLASVVFISLATAGPNYRERYEGQKLAANSADMMANQKELALQRANNELKSLTDERTALADALAKLQLDKDTQLAAAETKNLTLERKKGSADQKNTLLLALANSNNDRANQSEKLLAGTRDDLNRREAEYRDLSQRFQEKDAAFQRQEKEVASLNEDKTELLKELEARRSAGAASPAGTAAGTGAGASAAAEYTGTITAVRNDVASINIGASNGVKIGDKLIVYRDGKFVAYLQIESVDNNDAAGVIKDKQADPAQGDKVSSKITNSNL